MRIAGGAVKTRLCTDAFGYDAAIDYKAENLEPALSTSCPAGVDLYFDNTSGPISDAVLARINVGARVVVCGTAAVSSWEPPPSGPRVERHLLVKRARMQGFLVLDHVARFGEALSALTPWVRAGLVHYREDVIEGMEHAPGAIAGLYQGENLGKRLVLIAPDPSR